MSSFAAVVVVDVVVVDCLLSFSHFLTSFSSSLNSESVEFFTHVRKKWRHNVKHHPASSHVVDVCCGHGFTGLLFAIFERKCTLVTLLDRKRPNSFGKSCETAWTFIFLPQFFLVLSRSTSSLFDSHIFFSFSFIFRFHS